MASGVVEEDGASVSVRHNGVVHPQPSVIGAVHAQVEAEDAGTAGSGTVGTGCLLELTKTQGPWLNEGDVVELEIERIGILKNTIGGKK